MPISIDPEDFLDENGNVRRRDNVVAELTEGDMLIDHDRQYYIISDGELNIYSSGKRTGDGVPVLIPQDQLTQEFLLAKEHSTFDMNDLGLNIDESF